MQAARVQLRRCRTSQVYLHLLLGCLRGDLRRAGARHWPLGQQDALRAPSLPASLTLGSWRSRHQIFPSVACSWDSEL